MRLLAINRGKKVRKFTVLKETAAGRMKKRGEKTDGAGFEPGAILQARYYRLNVPKEMFMLLKRAIILLINFMLVSRFYLS